MPAEPRATLNLSPGAQLSVTLRGGDAPANLIEPAFSAGRPNAGARIVWTVMDKLGQQSLTVSDRGLRHGLLVHRFGT